MFSLAIVVAGNGPRPNVDALPNSRVAQIGQVIGLRPFSQFALFNLDEISHLGPFSQNRSGPDMRKGADGHIGLNNRLFNNRLIFNEHIRFQLTVFNSTRVEDTSFPNFCIPFKRHARMQNGV